MINIVGHTGFIGRNLISYFKNKGIEVSGVSVRNPDWKVQLQEGSFLVNLVGKAHDHQSVAIESEYYYANVELTKQIFECFLFSPAKVFIHISSIAALEEFESNSDLKEDDIPHPVSWYGKSKYAAEEWLLSQIIPLDKKIIILRPPMVHGSGDKGNLGLLYKFISKGIPYPLASFDNKRSFISIDNFSYFLEEIIKSNKDLVSGIYHISDDEAISTKDIILIIKKVINKRSRYVAFPQFLMKLVARIGDIIPIPLNTKRLKKMTSNLLVSNKKIKKALGVNDLPFSAHEGLEKTIRSFNED